MPVSELACSIYLAKKLSFNINLVRKKNKKYLKKNITWNSKLTYVAKKLYCRTIFVQAIIRKGFLNSPSPIKELNPIFFDFKKYKNWYPFPTSKIEEEQKQKQGKISWTYTIIIY